VAAASHLLVIFLGIYAGNCEPQPSAWLATFVASLAGGYLLDAVLVLFLARTP
jgi:hypothetical protein